MRQRRPGPKRLGHKMKQENYCSICSLKPKCTTAVVRKVTRDINEDARDRDRALAQVEPCLAGASTSGPLLSGVSDDSAGGGRVRPHAFSVDDTGSDGLTHIALFVGRAACQSLHSSSKRAYQLTTALPTTCHKGSDRHGRGAAFGPGRRMTAPGITGPTAEAADLGAKQQ
jgi:hypothetical protein